MAFLLFFLKPLTQITALIYTCVKLFLDSDINAFYLFESILLAGGIFYIMSRAQWTKSQFSISHHHLKSNIYSFHSRETVKFSHDGRVT